MKSLYSFLILGFVFFFVGCSTKEPIKEEQMIGAQLSEYEKLSWEQIDGFENDNHKEALGAFIQSCSKSEKNINLKAVCAEAKIAKNPKEFFKNNFTPYKILETNGTDKGLMTGYYEPLLKASKTKTKKFKYPILKTPKDLLTVSLNSLYPELVKYRLRGMKKEDRIIPYFSRGEIEKNIDKYESLFYVEDKVDLFFLQIQGSGKVQLENNQTINIGYDNQNGHPYYSVGKKLLEDPIWSAGGVSMQKIKEWAKAHSDKEVDELLNLNPSYVFFEQRKHGAMGSLGVELIPQRHIAVDRHEIPLGFLVFVDTMYPNNKDKFQKLVVAGDTGGAIKGKIRADIFFGFGDSAGELAGTMKQKGSMILFVPNKIIKKGVDAN